MKDVLYFLGQLSDRDVDWLIRHGRRVSLPPGKAIIHAGEPLDTLFVVLDGKLGVYLGATVGRPLAEIGTGEVVGEMSFVDACPPSATVRVEKDALVLAIPRQAVAAELQRNDGFAARFYRAIAMLLSHRLRRQNRAADGNEDGTGSEADELDPNVLDTVHLAGARFHEVLQRLLVSS